MIKLPSWPAEPDRRFVSLPLSVVILQDAVLAAVLWVTHFLHSSQFGIYEDDWLHVPKIVGLDWHGLWALIEPSLVTVSGRWRPLHAAFVFLFSFIGFRLGKLAGIYVMAFLINFANTLLFRAFLNKVFANARFAFLGALAYTVFPADTTEAFLLHALGLQTAMGLLLIAFLVYRSRWKPLSYLIAALIPFTYETPFLVFAAAPLLLRSSKRELWRHWIIMVLTLAGVTLVRGMATQTIVSHMDKKELILSCFNIVTGPLTCLAMYACRPITALLHINAPDALLIVLCFAAVAAVVAMAYSPAKQDVDPEEVSEGRRQWMIGVVMLLLAYPLTLTTTGIAVAGRGTRVHMAAALGGSILCAWAFSQILLRTSKTSQRWVVVSAIACFIALQLGFGLDVQRDYIASWQDERGFWTDLVALCPSLQDGDAVFVEPSGLQDTRQLLFLRKTLTGAPDTRQIESLDEVYRVLPILYAFPKEWQNPPTVFRLPLDWESKIFAGDGKLNPLTIEEGFAYEPGTRAPIAASQVIFLDTKDGRLTRRTFLIDKKDGTTLTLKSDSNSPGSLIKAPVYPYVIYPEGHARAPYLVK